MVIENKYCGVDSFSLEKIRCVGLSGHTMHHNKKFVLYLFNDSFCSSILALVICLLMLDCSYMVVNSYKRNSPPLSLFTNKINLWC